MARVSSPAPEETPTPSPAEEVVSDTAAPARPLPPYPGVGGSYLLDETEWVWVLQPVE